MAENKVLPTVGRLVLYKLSAADASEINKRRQDWHNSKHADTGEQAHVGNPASEGQVYPTIVVAVWPDEFGTGIPGINGQAFLDGNDQFWITSKAQGDQPGQWDWMPFQKDQQARLAAGTMDESHAGKV